MTVPAFSRMGAVTPSTSVIAHEVVAYLERNGTPLPDHPDTGTPVIWGMASGAEHGTGRALDFMVTGRPAVGDIIADYLWQHRERLGLIHVIWRQRIRSTRVMPGQWRAMEDRGSPTNNHMDHPHAFFDGRPVTPLMVTETPAQTMDREGELEMDEETLRKIVRSEIEKAWSKAVYDPNRNRRMTRNQLLILGRGKYRRPTK